MNNYELNEYQNWRKAKNIGEISFLKFKKVPITKIATYNSKSNIWFENGNKEADMALAEYYSKDYVEFFDVIQQTRKELFNLLKENENK